MADRAGRFGRGHFSPVWSVLILLIVLTALSSAPFAGQEAPYSGYNNGSDGLGHLFDTPAVAVGGATTHDGQPVRFVHGPLRGLAPLDDALLVVGPRLVYGANEVAEVRAFLEAGGRVLVADSNGTARSLVANLDIGLEMPAALVYSTSFVGDPDHPIANSTGTILRMPHEVVLNAPSAVLGAGEAVLVAHPVSWLDTNNNGKPDLGEPRGAWSYARHVRVGAGEIVVVGDATLFTENGDGGGRQAAAEALFDWLKAGRGTVVVDEGHRAATDPLGMSTVLAGGANAAAVLVVAAAVGVGLVYAVRLRVVRERARRRPLPTSRVSHAAARALDELER